MRKYMFFGTMRVSVSREGKGLSKGTNTVKEIKKPSVTGYWHGRDAIRQGAKLMLSILLVCCLYLVLSLLLSFDSLVLRILTSFLLVAAAVSYLYFHGVSVGQGDAAYGEIMYQRETEGKQIAPQDRERCFHPAKGFFSALLGALPFVLVALVFALLTKPETYTLGVLPSWLNTYARQSTVGDALAYYTQREGISFMIVLRIIVRSMVMPFINVAIGLGGNAVLWAERLAPLWVLVAPLGFGIGYGQGLKARMKVNTSIAIGDSRKRRRAKKEKQARRRAEERKQLV